MTVTDAIRAAAQKLARASDTARLDAELLMAHALGVSRSQMLIGKMRDAAPEVYDALIARRALCEPVAYITGEAEFYGRTFAVSSDVLIPRGDSEVLIEAAVEIAGNKGRILDLGTGSGALLLTLLAEHSEMSGLGIDASPNAILIAESNAVSLNINSVAGADDVDTFVTQLEAKGVSANPAQIAIKGRGRAEFRCLDWSDRGWRDYIGSFDLILCNPPYVEQDAELDSDVRDYEPASALFAGDEGLDDYRVIIPQLRKLMNENAIAIFEIGCTQAEAVTQLAEKAGFSVEMKRDLANRPRALIFRT